VALCGKEFLAKAQRRKEDTLCGSHKTRWPLWQKNLSQRRNDAKKTLSAVLIKLGGLCGKKISRKGATTQRKLSAVLIKLGGSLWQKNFDLLEDYNSKPELNKVIPYTSATQECLIELPMPETKNKK
jgi:hypothetical protein